MGWKKASIMERLFKKEWSVGSTGDMIRGGLKPVFCYSAVNVTGGVGFGEAEGEV